MRPCRTCPTQNHLGRKTKAPGVILSLYLRI
jgi:hypothetical protein